MISDTSVYQQLDISLYSLIAVSLALAIWAITTLCAYCKTKRCKPTIDDEGNTQPPNQVYDSYTIAEMVLVICALLLKIAFFGIVMTNTQLITEINPKYFETIQIVVVAIIGAALGIELDLWFKYECRIKCAGLKTGKDSFETEIRSIKDIVGGFILIFVMIYLLFIAFTISSKTDYNEWSSSTDQATMTSDMLVLGSGPCLVVAITSVACLICYPIYGYRIRKHIDAHYKEQLSAVRNSVSFCGNLVGLAMLLVIIRYVASAIFTNLMAKQMSRLVNPAEKSLYPLQYFVITTLTSIFSIFALIYTVRQRRLNDWEVIFTLSLVPLPEQDILKPLIEETEKNRIKEELLETMDNVSKFTGDVSFELSQNGSKRGTKFGENDIAVKKAYTHVSVAPTELLKSSGIGIAERAGSAHVS